MGKKEYSQEEIYSFLDILRESGVCNMFGAAPYLQEEFNLSRQEARTMLVGWMKSFNQRNTQ